MKKNKFLKNFRVDSSVLIVKTINYTVTIGDHSFGNTMEDYLKLQGIILAIQAKHHEFFESNNAIITDYVDLTDGLLTVVKFKNGLPQYIIDDILTEMEK